jgi:uncharacterized membrane-anchored protein YhcB (DUF1043 family)
VLGRVHDVFGSDSSDFPTSRSASFQPDLVHVFQKQFRQLSDTSTANARSFENVDDGGGSRCMIANVALYNRYARLIVHSFGLQRALDSRKADLPSAFAEVSHFTSTCALLKCSIKYQQSVSSKTLNRNSNQLASPADVQISSSPSLPLEQSHSSNAYNRNTPISNLIDNLSFHWRRKRPVSYQDQQLRLIIYRRCSIPA